jgi:hypothetical protein
LYAGWHTEDRPYSVRADDLCHHIISVWTRGSDIGMVKPAERPATIAIPGDNPVIGRALESLLASADYAARFYSEYPQGEAEPLGGARVALVLPASSSRRQEALLTLIRTTPSTTNLPVIELTTTPNESGHGTRLPWPCSIEDLRRSIDETLQNS